MPNYNNINGVRMTKWGPESEVDNPIEDAYGRIDEMYFDNGNLIIVFERSDNGSVIDLQIPVKARESWNSFVESLPTWGFDNE